MHKNYELKCIYCGNKINRDSDEHIILASFGSKLSSKNLICTKCNNFFSIKKSGSIDKELSTQFDTFKNLLDIKNSRGKKPPAIRNIIEKDGVKYDLLPGNELKQKKIIREIIDIDEKNKKVNITTSDYKSAEGMIDNLKKQYGDKFTLDSIKNKREYENQQMHFKFRLGGKFVSRAVAKALVNFIYYLKREKSFNIINSESTLLNVKNVIMNKDDSQELEYGIDYQDFVKEKIDNVNFSHKLILIGNKSHKKIIGIYIVFGCIPYTITISDTYNENNFYFCYEESPITGDKKLISTPKKEIEYNFEKLPISIDNSFIEYEKNIQNSINDIMRHYYAISNKKNIRGIIDESFNEIINKRNNDEIDDELSESEIFELSTIVSRKVIEYKYRINSEIDITEIYNEM